MRRPSRRDVLQTAPLGLVAVAGCLDGSVTTPSDTATDTETETETDTPTQETEVSTLVGDAVVGNR